MKRRIPKNSWLDTNGKRWIIVVFDVMTNGGGKFLRQVKVTLGVRLDFGTGRYIIDIPPDEIAKEIVRQYPSLARVKEPLFYQTENVLSKQY